MTTVILVAHIIVSIVLVVVVLMQRSEGGALGIGGGGGGPGGGLMSGRGAASALVRTTIIFGAIFFVTSLTLTTIATRGEGDGLTDIERELREEALEESGTSDVGIGTLDDILAPSDTPLGEDPLAVDPLQPETPDSDETTQEGDPLSDPQ